MRDVSKTSDVRQSFLLIAVSFFPFCELNLRYKLETSENFATYQFQLLFADRYVYLLRSNGNGSLGQITCLSSPQAFLIRR